MTLFSRRRSSTDSVPRQVALHRGPDLRGQGLESPREGAAARRQLQAGSSVSSRWTSTQNCCELSP
jgi:hypothetical protein